jgi:CheY-like chemotaxis protein/nitrogen-specific signal transduction histidine kinase
MAIYINLKFKINIDLKNEYMNLKKSAEYSDKVKSDFVANMSHEIRTPMNSIIGMAYLLQNTELNLRQKDYVEKLKISANSLLKLLNNILDFSKMESGKLILEKREFDLYKSMYEISNINVLLASKKNINIYLKLLNSKIRYVVGDSLRFEQVINNIISNSIKFTEEGYIIVEYINSIEEKNKIRCYFMVEDTGIGIHEKDYDKIFSVFSQADASITRKYGGSGLGLAISKSIVEECGGKINIISHYNKGTKIFFNMEFEKSNKENKFNNINLDYDKQKICILSEDPINREILNNYIMDFKSKNFLTFEDAHVFLKQNKIDEKTIFIIDLCYGNFNRRNLIKDILHIVNKSTDSIIVTLQFGDEESLNFTKSNGLKNIILKPFCQFRFLEYIDKVINSIKINSDLKEKDIICNRFEGKRILLVDDDTENANIIKDILIECGFIAEVVSSGEAAYEKINEKDYDLILMDIMMPGWDGYETLENIRKLNKYNKIPIIALSAITKDKSTCGFDAFITKPFNPETLIGIICEKFEESKLKNQIKNNINGENLLFNLNQINKKLKLMGKYLDKYQPKPCRDILQDIDKIELPYDIEYDYRKMKIFIDRFDFKNSSEINKLIINKITNKIDKYYSTKV